MTSCKRTCTYCNRLNVFTLDNIDVIRDTVNCSCGKPLNLPVPTCINYKWVASDTVGRSCDPANGKFRLSCTIYPVCDPEDLLTEGAVMTVYGDTEPGVRSLAKLLCDQHNDPATVVGVDFARPGSGDKTVLVTGRVMPDGSVLVADITEIAHAAG